MGDEAGGAISGYGQKEYESSFTHFANRTITVHKYSGCDGCDIAAKSGDCIEMISLRNKESTEALYFMLGQLLGRR